MAFRADRMMSIYLAQPLCRLAFSVNTSIPILMYHSISDEQGSRMRPYYETRTSINRFTEQMQWLKSSGYRTVGLDHIFNPNSKNGHGSKQVVITFDDGFHDFYSNAVPLLTENGFTATMFLPTGYISDVRQTFKHRECMTWSEVRELQRAGFTFGSHTVTHPQLHLLQRHQIEYEVKTSKQMLEDATGTSVASFAYPYAFPETDRVFAAWLRKTLESCGYRAAVSTIIGTAIPGSAEFFLKRLPMNDWDDLDLFRAKMEGAYNWVHAAQWLSKRVKQARA